MDYKTSKIIFQTFSPSKEAFGQLKKFKRVQ